MSSHSHSPVCPGEVQLANLRGYGRDRASGQSDLPLESFPEKSNYSTHDVMDREFHLDESDLSRGNGPGKGG